METYDFTFTLNRAPTDDEVETLFGEGCDDGSPEYNPIHNTGSITFDREASSLALAIASAVADVEKVPGLRVVGVSREDGVTLTDIARRVGRTRESIRLYAAGKRGPGGFPAPDWTTASGERFWSWAEVAVWFRDVLGEDVTVPPHELLTADRLLQARAALADEPDERDRAELSKLLAA